MGVAVEDGSRRRLAAIDADARDEVLRHRGDTL
jgi:hypothetical protein